MTWPNCWAEEFEAVAETDERSLAKAAGVEVTVGISKVEVGFNSSLLELDTLLVTCQINDVTFMFHIFHPKESDTLTDASGEEGGTVVNV